MNRTKLKRVQRYAAIVAAARIYVYSKRTKHNRASAKRALNLKANKECRVAVESYCEAKQRRCRYTVTPDGIRIPNVLAEDPRDKTKSSVSFLDHQFRTSILYPNIPNTRFVQLQINKKGTTVTCSDTFWLKETLTQVRKFSYVPVKIRKNRHNTGHATMLYFNHTLKQIEYFDPCYRKCPYQKQRDRVLREWLQLNVPWTKEYEFNTTRRYCVYGEAECGPQRFTRDNNCGIWCSLYVYLKSINYNKDSESIWYSFCNRFIQQYGIRWKRQLAQWIQRYKFRSRIILLQQNNASKLAKYMR